ncbi:MAG: heme biosynthesis protein HemY [Xanthobacteraceae bacterium]|nr:heme biosynthesis protein HemY [Xanthobacteraceae bacterium]
MIRFIIFLLVTAGLAFAAAWLADRPGAVSIDWLGYHADTSVGVLIGAVLAIVCAVLILWSLLGYLLRAPRKVVHGSRARRAARGHHAITQGLVAIGAGDVHAALRHARDAARHAADQPLALLLQAQTAQLAGTRNGADSAFRAMAERPETKLLGLRGLFIEAQRRNDAAAARGFAEEAAKQAPSLAWAGQATFDFHCADGDWGGALEALERNNRGGLLDKDTYRRQRAVLLTAQATSLEASDRAAASALAQEAVKLCPGLTPAATLAGRLLAEAGERRRAGRILEAAWREEPHPDIADAYADIVPGASARERLARMRTLARMAESHLESRLAVARTAVDAHEFAEARESLKPLLATPTRRVATLMAHLEEAETGNIGRAREWMARAVHAALDPVWTADGLIAEHWMPVSPATGRLDAFRWRVPVADLTPRGPLLEPAAAPVVPGPAIPAPASPPTKDVTPAIKPPQAQPRTDSVPSAPPPPKPAPTPEPVVEASTIEVVPAPVKGTTEIAPASARPPPPSLPAKESAAPAEAPILVPDDPGPEPQSGSAARSAEARARRSWFSRNTAG